MRKPIIVGNWKMNKNNAETKAFFEAVDGVAASENATYGIGCPFTDLRTALDHAKNLVVAAENCHFEDNGAFTGEVSVPMLEEMGVKYCIIGHSERREMFGDTDETVNKKAKRLIVPYVFVGLCYAPLKLLLSQFANKPYNIHDLWKMLIGINPDGELWFLYALFVISVIAIIVEGVNSKIILLISLIVTLNNSFLIIVTNHAFYFFLGAYIRNNTCCLFDKNLKIASLHFIVFVSANLMQKIFGYYPVGHILTAVSGIYLTLFISELLANIHNKATVILTTLGLYSMDVYILSDIIKIPFRIILWNKLHLYYVTFFVCTFLSLLLSYYISKLVIRKNNLLKKLILGE